MTATLALGDPATVAELIGLQRAAYRVEAPAGAGETFIGARGGGRLVGALGHRRADGIVDVRRLVVHPDAVRRGVKAPGGVPIVLYAR